MGLHIGMTYDLRADYLALGFTQEQVAEFDSDATINELEAAIKSLWHRVERIGNAWALCKRLVAGDRWQLVFNICEGVAGRSRESQVPALLELYNVGYTFSDPLVCAVTLDKAYAKRVLMSGGLRTARFGVVNDLSDIDGLAGLSDAYPLFAKPIAEGTGKGIDSASRIDNASQLRETCSRLLEKFQQPVLVEEYLPGREFTTALLGTGREARVLGTMELRMRDHAGTDIYSYEMKEKCESLVEYFPMPAGELRKEVEELALQSYRLLECRDGGRVDVRLDRAGRPTFLEVNPLPGLHPTHSDLPMIATQEGMTYAELLGAIINSAARRLGLNPAD